MSARIRAFDSPLPHLLYWDASFLVHATYPGARYHAECVAFLDLLDSAEGTFSYVSTLTLDETLFAILQLKVAEDHSPDGFWEVYRDNPQVIQRYLGELRALVNRLWIDPRIRIVGVEGEMIYIAFEHMESFSLLPRDALHVSTMIRYGIEAIVTTDQDFVSIDGLDLYTCNPRILSQSPVA